MEVDDLKLGDKVKDLVTGYTGIATSKTEFLNGCIQVEITRKLKKDENPSVDNMVAGIGIDIQQLVRVDAGINKQKEISKSSSGGRPRQVTKKLY